MGESELILTTTVHPVLERMAGTPRARKDLFAVISTIMESFVDRAYGIDAVQQATALRPDNVSSEPVAIARRNRRVRSGQRRRSRAIHTRITNASNKRRTRWCRKKIS